MTNLSNYKAVILAGGKGTRLYPITYEIPKPLLPVKKKPIINYSVDLFLNQGVKEIAILINRNFQEEFSWWKKRYYPSTGSGRVPSVSSDKSPEIKIVKEKESLGTFGGLCYLKNWIGNSPFFLANGDELKEIDLRKMSEFHNKLSVIGTVALVRVPNPRNFGVVICEKGIVQQFLEKPENPPTNYINSGLYLFSPEIFQYHPGPQFLMVETDIFPKLAGERKLGGFPFQGKWMTFNSLSQYEDILKNWA